MRENLKQVDKVNFNFPMGYCHIKYSTSRTSCRKGICNVAGHLLLALVNFALNKSFFWIYHCCSAGYCSLEPSWQIYHVISRASHANKNSENYGTVTNGKIPRQSGNCFSENNLDVENNPGVDFRKANHSIETYGISGWKVGWNRQ